MDVDGKKKWEVDYFEGKKVIENRVLVLVFFVKVMKYLLIGKWNYCRVVF